MTGEVKMTQRDIGAEILTCLEEISAWEKGEIELKTTELKLATARDVARIRVITIEPNVQLFTIEQ